MNEKTHYLFVDLEWEEKHGRPTVGDQILEIGATKSDEATCFMEYIRPNGLVRKKTLNILRLTNQLNGGVKEEKAVYGLDEYAYDSNITVVWSDSTRDKLKLLAEKYNKPNIAANIVVLQEIITQLSKAIDSVSFHRALLMTNAKYASFKMHNAGFDAECLKDLFFKVCKQYEKDNTHLFQNGVVKFPTSKIYHTCECKYVKGKISDGNVFSFKDVIYCNPCKRCMRQTNLLKLNVTSHEDKKIRDIVLLKGRRVKDKEIQEIADFFKLSIYKADNCITVVTGYSIWKVYCRKGYANRLEHENHVGRANINSTSNNSGFHEHPNFEKDIYSLFEYISIHDNDGHIRSIAEDMERKQKRKDKLKKMQKSRKYLEQDEWEEYQDDIYDNNKSKMKTRKRM